MKKTGILLTALVLLLCALSGAAADGTPGLFAASCPEDPQASPDLFREVGSVVTLGTYPISGDGTDRTPIQWLVLDYDEANHRALLISVYGLDAKRYNETRADVTWEDCSLRAWLNSNFLRKAFTPEEQSAILLTDVDNSAAQGYAGFGASGGNNTQDRIFLLSCAEAYRYFGATYDDTENMHSRLTPTAYAVRAGARTNSTLRTANGNITGWWWLRSPGRNQNRAAQIREDGSVSSTMVDSTMEETRETIALGCVRPAMWVDVTASL